MTCAVAKALMVTKGQSDDVIREELIKQMKEFGRRYLYHGFGGMMLSWLKGDSTEPYDSWVMVQR